VPTCRRFCSDPRREETDAREVPAELGSADVHTGECEIVGDDVAGLAVHIGARVSALAGDGEVLLSRTVRDLVVGSGLEFRPRGVHELKGVPGPWEIYALESGGSTAVPVPAQPTPVRTADRVVLAVARRAPGLLRLAARSQRG
jgi:class 3 adenylate cyclase